MAFQLWLWPVLLVILYLAHVYFSLYKNVQACKKTGIPYIIVPFNPHSILAQILYPIWHPLLSLLPSPLKGNWFIFMKPDLLWSELYAPFRKAGSDTVFTVSANGIQLQTAAADVISQITERRNDFPKPTHIYDIIDIYGKTIISSEGDIWKKHRKLTAQPFNEKNNHIVWLEAIRQAREMLDHVIPQGADSSASLDDLENLASRAALAIISKAGYGVQINWPKPKVYLADSSQNEASVDSSVLGDEWIEGRTNGHKMSYADAIFSVSHDVFWLFAVPRIVLKHWPSKAARRAYVAHQEWGQYMREMIDAKRKEQSTEKQVITRGTDLLSSLVKNSGNVTTFVNDNTTKSGKIGIGGLSDDELMGDAFVLIMAGHETTAGALQYGLLLLAMNVGSQRRLQREVDRIFATVPPEQWDYERDFARAFGGMVGAVLAETLRWLPSVPGIPKWTPSEQHLTVNGARCSVPKDAVVTINAPAAHRNPHQWPTSKPSRPTELEHPASNPDDDLGEWKPERWLLSLQDDGSCSSSEEDDNGKAMKISEHPRRPSDDSSNIASAPPTAADLASTLLRPRRGAYLPFSEGGRACLGRRFSQVEMTGLLSVIFQRCSVELAVDEWASDEEVERMDEGQKREVWLKARDAARYKFRHGMRNLMTNRMAPGTSVPVRFVRRGGERFGAEGW